MPVEIQQIALAVGAALVYSIVFYAKNYASDDPDEFNPYKIGATLLVGLVVGIGAGLAGIDVSQTLIFEQLAMYAGTIALLETIIKSIWRQFKKGRNSAEGPPSIGG